MATLMKVDGAWSKVLPKDGGTFDLQEMYALVETDIVQFVYLTDDQILVICEEGKLRDKPRNEPATQLAHADCAISPKDYIAGTALLCSREEAGFYDDDD